MLIDRYIQVVDNLEKVGTMSAAKHVIRYAGSIENTIGPVGMLLLRAQFYLRYPGKRNAGKRKGYLAPFEWYKEFVKLHAAKAARKQAHAVSSVETP